MGRSSHFWTGLAGVMVGALMVAALPAIAQDAETQAQPGDPMLVGQTNSVNANTSLRGDATSNLVLRNTGDGTPLNLITEGNGKAPMKVDSRRVVKNLNTDTLDFRHANQLIRAAFGETDNAVDADGDLVTATITAPKPGILVMGGSVDSFANPTTGANDFFYCRLTVNGTVVSGSSRGTTVHDAGGDHTENWNENCSTDGALVVDGDTTYTVALRADSQETVLFDDASVWVIWVPFDGDGKVPTG